MALFYNKIIPKRTNIWKSILVICQELFEKDFDVFFRKKGNFNRHSVCISKKTNVSSIQYDIRCPAFRRCTVGFWPAIQKRVVRIYEM